MQATDFLNYNKTSFIYDNIYSNNTPSDYSSYAAAPTNSTNLLLNETSSLNLLHEIIINFQSSLQPNGNGSLLLNNITNKLLQLSPQITTTSSPSMSTNNNKLSSSSPSILLATAITTIITSSAAPSSSPSLSLLSSSTTIGTATLLALQQNISTTTTIPVTSSLNISSNYHQHPVLSWQKTFLVVLFSILIIITIIGNTLVILSVITTRRLRTVTNCFVMSLAIADWMVGVFVMPPDVLLFIYESWKVGWILCDIWISLDILLCTASILSLCAISLDRYLAVTQPLHYKKRRTKRLALFMIFMVWVVALAITCPPILGWYEPGRRKSGDVDCRYNQNKGYVVFSAMGSFFIPMTVMLYVYTRICCVLTSRHNSMAKTEASERTINDDIEVENITSEYESNHSPRQKYNLGRAASHNSSQPYRTYSQKSFDRADSHHTLYELVEISKSSSTIRSSTITCKFAAASQHQFKPIQALHFCQSQTSISESCLSSSKLRIHSNGKRMPIRISSSKRETKAAQTLSMVVGGFIACWLPFFIYYLLIPFLPKESVSDTAMLALTWLGWLNSAINPFIYAFYSTDFRIAFWRLTFRKFCKNQNNLLLMKS